MDYIIMAFMRENSNKGVHYGTKAFEAEDKPAVANAVYAIAVMIWSEL